jgi:hypothetical protein
MLSEITVGELNQLFGLVRVTGSRKLRYRWTCHLAAQEVGDFFFAPLLSTKELVSEGWHMQHCVATYDAQCAKGLYQVFSIRDLLGKRLATLGLAYGGCGWKVHQCLGKGNTVVLRECIEWLNDNGKHVSIEDETDLHYVALEIARLLNSVATD